MFSQTVVTLLPLCFMLASCAVMNINIEKNPKVNKCGKSVTLDKESQVTIVANGEIPGASCVVTVNTTECGVCFQFENYAFFNTTLASVTVSTGSLSKVVDADNPFPTASMCSEKKGLTVNIMHDQNYAYDPNEPGYRFVLDVYNKCGYRGSAKSVTFEDVVKHAKGYHHGEEMENREISNLVTGLVVGLCLASIFLVVLLIAYCYVKNSPNRGASKSAGMPRVGAKGNMNVQSSQGQPKQDVEMVAYKAKEGDRPEGKPLLTGAAAAGVLLSTDKSKPKSSAEKKRKGSSGSSASSNDHVDDHDADKKEPAEAEKPEAPVEPVVTVTSDSNTTSGGVDSGVGGGSSDYTSGGGGGSSDYTSGGGGYSYSGGGYSSGGGDYSSGGGGGGGGGSSCGGGGGSSCGGGGSYD